MRPHPEGRGARILAAVLGVALAPVALASLGRPISWTGRAWLATLGVVVVALAVGSPRALRVAAVAAALWALTVIVTLAWPAPAARFLDSRVWPGEAPAPRWERLFAERDISLTGFRAMGWLGAVGEDELAGFAPELASLYTAIAAAQGPFAPTPFLATTLGMQRRDRFDVLAHDAGARRVVVFLHGYSGSFVSYCFVVADAAARAGWGTVCPATTFDGAWYRGDGPAIASRVVRTLRARGASRVVLAGLSNGGIGASRLAGALDVDGLALISGLDPDAPAIARPTLVWHGARDPRFPLAEVQRYGQGAPDVERVVVDSDHFALVRQRARLAADLARLFARVAASGE